MKAGGESVQVRVATSGPERSHWALRRRGKDPSSMHSVWRDVTFLKIVDGMDK